MLIRFNIKNSFGDFFSEKLNVTEEEFIEIEKMSKTFWISNEGFNMWMNEGNSIIIFPPNIIANSILIIDIIEK